MNAIYELDKVCFNYSPNQSLFADLSVKINNNRLTAIVGPNGSGKSTLLRILCGLIKPTKGEVRLFGIPLEHYSKQELAKRIAMLPQVISPLFSLSVEEVVALGRFPHKSVLSYLTQSDLEIVNNCIEKMGLTELKNRNIEELSTGEFKKTVLASILAQEPEILLLDEPLSGLDTPFQLELLFLLQSLISSGLTVIITTHEINLITRFADEILLLSSNHSLLNYGKPTEVLTSENLKSAYGCEFWVGRHPLTNSILIEPIRKNEK